jgi:hypothetical protein
LLRDQEQQLVASGRPPAARPDLYRARGAFASSVIDIAPPVDQFEVAGSRCRDFLPATRAGGADGKPCLG